MRRGRKLLAPGVLGLGSLLLWGACSTPIYHGLDEPAANEAVSSLERAGIAAQKVASGGGEGGFTVSAPSGSVPRALEVLRAAGLPRPARHGFAETFGKPSLIPSGSEEKARLLDAMQGEIARTLELVDGVTAARVHVVLAERDPLAPSSEKPTTGARASVLLKTKDGKPPVSEADVQKLVAGSVPNLDPTDVAVVITPAPEAPGEGTALTAVGPLRVAPGSRSVVLIFAGGLLLVVAVLAFALLQTARRLAASERR